MNNSTDGDTSAVGTIISNAVQNFLLLLNFVVGVAYILLILIQKKFRSNKLNWLTVNVCLATAVFSFMEFIFTIFRTQNLSVMSCRLQGFLIAMSVGHMMFSHCISSFNRLLAIRYFHKLLFRSSRWLLVSMAIGWIIGVLISIPYLLYDNFACSPSQSSTFLTFYLCVTVLIIPICIVTICNASIFRYISQISRRVHDVSRNKKNNHISRKRDAQVSKIMLMTFALFVIGWTPIFCLQLFTTSNSQLLANLTTFFLFLLEACLLGNTILLIYANQPVRQLIKENLKCNGKFLFIFKC